MINVSRLYITFQDDDVLRIAGHLVENATTTFEDGRTEPAEIRTVEALPGSEIQGELLQQALKFRAWFLNDLNVWKQRLLEEQAVQARVAAEEAQAKADLLDATGAGDVLESPDVGLRSIGELNREAHPWGMADD